MKTALKKKRGKVTFKHVGLSGLKKDLARFEKKYGMTTNIFLQKVEQGELAESNDFIDWLGLAETLQSLSEEKAT
jgi:hypothetical protein